MHFIVSMTVTLIQYKAMSATQRNKINKNDLVALLDETVDDSNIMTKLDVIINELKLMKEKSEKQDGDIKKINGTVTEHGNILAAHQKFMEGLDAEKRAKHLVVLGLKEETHGDDHENFLGIIDAIGVKRTDVVIESAERLGNVDEEQPNRTRPLKITLQQSSMKGNILRNSNKLKDQPEGSPYKRVFLKKDQHPDIRNEEKRLYEVFKAERNKPENAHIEVVFNRKLRIVTVNGDEIDRFKLFSGFH